MNNIDEDNDDHLIKKSSSSAGLKSDRFVEDINSYVYSAPNLNLNYDGRG
jgi:hypothetical protein